MHKLQLSLSVMAGLVMIVVLLCAFNIPLGVTGNLHQSEDDLIAGWMQENGETVSLQNSFGKTDTHHTFTRTINGSTIDGRSLCLISHNINFTVWLDDELLYDYQPELGGFYGKRYGEALHTVTFPTFTNTRELRIEAVSLRQDGTCGCNEAYLTDSHAFMRHIESTSAIRLGFCVLTFFFGILVLLVGVIEDSTRGEMLEAVCLGAITIISSTWIGSQTMTMRVLCHNSAILRMLEYLALDLLPIPMLLFIATFTNHRKNPVVMTLVSLSTVNTIGTALLVRLGVIDYADMLIVTHLLIAVGAAVAVYFVARGIWRKELSRRKSTYLISAASILIVAGMLDMLRFYLHGGTSGNYSFLTEMGLFIFSAVLAVYEYRRVIEMQVRSSQAELMQTLAMEDALTKLGSRAAFVALEKSLMERTEGVCLFVHFDVNNLKRVNDVYGHAEGDRHLIGAANVLRESFGDCGKLFRVGGDEFFAVLDTATCQTDYPGCVECLEAVQAAYNEREKPPVPLEIAYGMAEYECTGQSPETAERLADSRMYEKKREMKAKSKMALNEMRKAPLGNA